MGKTIRALALASITASLLCAHAPVAWADGLGLPIRVKIIQCGNADELRLSCERDDRCCVFMDRSTPVENEKSVNHNFSTSIKITDAQEALRKDYPVIRSASALSARP